MGRRRTNQQPSRVLQSKRLFIFLGLLLASGLAIGVIYAIQYSRQAPSLLELARKATTERNFPRAVQLYDEYLKLSPKDAAVYAELGQVYDDFARASLARRKEANDFWNKSTDNYEVALTWQSDLDEERLKLAKLYTLLQKFTRAEHHIKILQAKDTYKNDPNLFCLLADGASNDEGRIPFLKKAIDTKSATPDTYRALANLIRKVQGKTNNQALLEADDLMRNLVKTRDKDLDARLALSRYYLETSRLRECRDEIRYAYESIPGGADNVEIILMHADTLANDNLPAAKAVLEKGVANHPDETPILLGLAEVELRAGNRVRSRELLMACEEKIKDGDVALLDVGDRLLDLGETAHAEDAAKRLKVFSEYEPLSAYLQGRIHLAAGNWPTAIQELAISVPALEFSPRVLRKKNLLVKAYLAQADCFARALNPAAEVDALHRAAKLDETLMANRLKWIDGLLRLGETDKAKTELRNVSTVAPSAKVMLVKLLLADELRRPSTGGSRDLREFWATIGSEQMTTALAPIVADAYLVEGKPEKAEAVLKEALKAAPSAPAYLRLAAIKGTANGDAAMTVLNEAEAALGPQVDLHIAKAAWLARKPKPDVPAIVALTEQPALQAEQFRLQSNIGELLLSVGKTTEGMSLIKLAMAKQPYDLASRIAVFDWATDHKDSELQADMLQQIRGIDGAEGAFTLFGEVIRELSTNARLTADQTASIRERLNEVEKKRPNWGPIARVRGQLAERAGQMDAALDEYQQAIERGERSETLVRQTVNGLMMRQRYAQALQLLGKLSNTSGLSTEMDRRFRVMESVAANDQSRALGWVQSETARKSRNYQDHVLRALVLAQNGQLDQAKEAFAVARGLSPESPEVYVNQIRVFSAAGMSQEQLRSTVELAEKELGKAKPANPATLPLAFGEMYEVIGDLPKAQEFYKSAVKANPNDAETSQHLFDLFLRSQNRAAARQFLLELGADANLKPEIVRWAKRMRANLETDTPQGYKEIPAAIKLLDENIAQSENTDDIRAKAFILARDPFQRSAALRTITESRKRGPLTPDQSFRLALIYLQAGQGTDAENALLEATGTGLLANPNHLALLSKLQLDGGSEDKAKITINRLKLLAPNQPIAIVEEARLLAKTDKTKAAELIRKLPDVGDPYSRTKTIGRVLEELNCLEQAEQYYLAFSKGAEIPDGNHIPLVEFYIRRGRSADAITLALDAQQVKPNCPTFSTARLLTGALKATPDFTVPNEKRESWKAASERAERFITEQSTGSKPNGELLSAMAELADVRGRYDDALKYYRSAIEQIESKVMQAKLKNNVAMLSILRQPDVIEAPLRLINEAVMELGPESYLLDTRGMVWLAAGKPEKAIEDLQAAIGSAPSPVLLFHIARTYDRLKANDEREAALNRAKALGLKKEQLHPLEWTEYERLVVKSQG